MQGMNDSKEKPESFPTEKKKTSPKSHKFSVVPALLSRLWWLSSSSLITYSQGLKHDVLQRVVGIAVCCTQAPGTLWLLGNLGNSRELRAPWEPLAVPLASSHLLWWITVFGGLWLSALGHTPFWWLFFICFSFPLMCSELENWKGLNCLFGKWCHRTFFMISPAGSEGFDSACLAPPGLSQLLSQGSFWPGWDISNWAERLRLVLSAMAGWNITEFRDVATKGPQSLPSSWCCMYTLKNHSLPKAQIIILLKNYRSAGRKR